MSHIWSVFRYELQRFGRRPGYLFATFGLPIVGFVLLMGYQLLNSSSDPQDAAESEFIASTVNEAGVVDLSGLFADTDATGLTFYPDEASARAALDAGDVDGYFVIAADYSETGNVMLVIPRISLSALAARSLIDGLIFERLSETVDTDLLERMQSPIVTMQTIDVSDAQETQRSFDQDYWSVYVFALLLTLALFITNGYLLQSVVEEKETRLIEVLVSSVRPTQLLTGKILAMTVLGLLQVSVWIGAMLMLISTANTQAIEVFVRDIRIPTEDLPVILIFFVLGYLMFAGIYGGIGAISNSMQEGPQYVGLFTFISMMPLMFSSTYLSDPASPLVVGMSLFPITAPLGMVQRIILTNVPLLEIVLSVALLIVVDVVVIWAAGRLFRVQSLLAGQLPKLRDLPRLIMS